jgi:hypothetical protein
MPTHFGELNVLSGWIWMSLGITTGAILGIWSFGDEHKAPKGHLNYTDLPRRLNRLAHISCFMLPLISIVYGQYIDTVPLTDTLKHVASIGMLVCMIGIPVSLFMASFYLPFKNLSGIPIAGGMIAFYLMAWGNLKIVLGMGL